MRWIETILASSLAVGAVACEDEELFLETQIAPTEIAVDPGPVLTAIRQQGLKCGLAVNPATPVEAIYPYLDELDLALVMSVEPGFGGQSFQDQALEKIRSLAVEIARRGLDLPIEVDGGVNANNAAACREAGARLLVAGSAVFRAEDPALAIAALRG